MSARGTFDRRWVIIVIAILVVLLVLATTVILIFSFESTFGGRSTFPGLVVRNVQTGCSNLEWSQQSSTSTNRTLLFQCPGTGSASYALRTNTFSGWAFYSRGSPYYPVYGTTPTFTLPQGYLSLSLTAGDCSNPSASPFAFIPLKTSEEIVVGWNAHLYDYCAVIDNGVSHPTSFAIDWSPGTPPTSHPAPFTLSASPTQTVPYGKNATYTITVTSLNGWTGNVTVDLRGGYTIEIPAQFTPASVIVKAGGSNTTTMIQPTFYPAYAYYAPRGTHTIVIDGSTRCISMVMGVCLDSYNEVSLGIQIDIV